MVLRIRAIIRAVLVSTVLGVLLLRPAAAEDLSYEEIFARAEQGNAFYQKTVGTIHEANDDLKGAAHWYKMAALMNNVRAQLLLANAYQHGRGVPQSPTVAVAWYMVASVNCGRKQLSVEAFNGPLPSAQELEVAGEIAVFLSMLVGENGPPDCEEYDDR